MTHIPSGETKDYLKLEIQQLIVKHKYPTTADTHDVVEPQCEEDSGDQEEQGCDNGSAERKLIDL